MVQYQNARKDKALAVERLKRIYRETFDQGSSYLALLAQSWILLDF